ncbi:MAG TPA: DUF2203 domain-containing protein [Ignavibacteriaceae bacterium]|jgi:hypothetical protein|nr:DUF2203 domain-containing protein [Ignavibacteriaceae bacterium]
MVVTKFFTVSEANKTLPLVKQIVEDIMKVGNELKSLSVESPFLEEVDEERKQKLVQLEGYIDELKEIGCQFKAYNFDIGLVDFPALINDEEVFLCWRSDEKSIRFYHGVDSGYTGRHPIPEEYYF